MPNPLTFLAAIADTTTAIKVAGGNGEGGKLTLDVSGDDLPSLLKLVLYRGKVLRVTVEVADGNEGEPSMPDCFLP